MKCCFICREPMDDNDAVLLSAKTGFVHWQCAVARRKGEA
jgi:hypothetical protein